MKKFKAFIVALALIATLLFVAVGASSPSPASAVTSYATCTYSPSGPTGGSYAMSYCTIHNTPGGSFWTIRVTCRYYQLWSYHTYFKYGNTAANGSWSTATCPNGDEAIHAFTVFSNPSVLFGTGSW